MKKVKEILEKIWNGIKLVMKNVFKNPFATMLAASIFFVVCFMLGIEFPANIYALYALAMLLLSIAEKLINVYDKNKIKAQSAESESESESEAEPG